MHGRSAIAGPRGWMLALLIGACAFHPGVAIDNADTGTVNADAFVGFARRINIAGVAFSGTDYPGMWEADSGNGATCTGSNAGPSTAPTDISGTVDDPLFVKHVYGIPTTTCSIAAVPAGNYEVTLLFGPLYYGAGGTCMFPTRSQIFDIALEGVTVLPAFDLTMESNGCVANGAPGSHPVARTFSVAVSDGTLDIMLTATSAVEASMVSAIQVVQVP